MIRNVQFSLRLSRDSEYAENFKNQFQLKLQITIVDQVYAIAVILLSID